MKKEKEQRLLKVLKRALKIIHWTASPPTSIQRLRPVE